MCTGNSCRSQIAEAIVNSQLGQDWEAYSAGIKPAGYVHDLALQVLEEIGIHHYGVSKDVSSLQDISFDLVVTVCNSAAEECPIWLGEGDKIHIGFLDPAEAVGTKEEIKEVFREIRNTIKKEVVNYLKEIL